MRKNNLAIIIFAKAPVAGQVKTRLIPYFQAEQAATLHRQLVEHTLSTVKKGQHKQIELWCAPDVTHPFFKLCEQKYNVALKKQQGTTLGERMAHAFKETLQHSRFAIILGTDCPILSISNIEQALEKLQQAYDVVISPAEDGGYALLGLTAFQPDIFEGINWGNDNVLSQTRYIMDKARLDYYELDMLWDIDRPEDYERLKTHPKLKHLYLGTANK